MPLFLATAIVMQIMAAIKAVQLIRVFRGTDNHIVVAGYVCILNALFFVGLYADLIVRNWGEDRGLVYDTLWPLYNHISSLLLLYIFSYLTNSRSKWKKQL